MEWGNGTGLTRILQRLQGRTNTSRKCRENYHRYLADSRASAGFHAGVRDVIYPIVGERAAGARIWDADGNQYVDLAMGFGVQLFGHAAPFIQEALLRQIEAGLHLGPQARLAGVVAEQICDITRTDRLCFCNSGSEAVMTALRLARTATGRQKIAMFKWSYHGHFDGTLGRPSSEREVTVALTPGIPSGLVKDLIMLDYGEPSAFVALDEHRDELAAVIVEPVQSLRPGLQPRTFLHSLAAWTQKHGIVLIFDEILTGFRIHQRGAQEYFGVAADLVTYGKILGGGLPIGIVAGKTELLAPIDGGPWSLGSAQGPRARRTFFAGTFNKNPLTVATAHAVLSKIEEEGPELQRALNWRTECFAKGVNEWCQEQQIPLQIVHFGSLFRFVGRAARNIGYALIERGVYVWEGGSCFLSTAHSAEDLAIIAEAVKDALGEMRDGR